MTIILFKKVMRSPKANRLDKVVSLSITESKSYYFRRGINKGTICFLRERQYYFNRVKLCAIMLSFQKLSNN